MPPGPHDLVLKLVLPRDVYLEGVGADRGGPSPRHEVEATKAWLSIHARRSRMFNSSLDSDALKPPDERGCDEHGIRDTYVSNGAFILAEPELGYEARRAPGWNAYFKMDRNADRRRGTGLPEGL